MADGTQLRQAAREVIRNWNTGTGNDLLAAVRELDATLAEPISPLDWSLIDLLATARTAITEQWDGDHEGTLALIADIDNVLDAYRLTRAAVVVRAGLDAAYDQVAQIVAGAGENDPEAKAALDKIADAISALEG